MIGRKTLTSERARTRRIDIFFERLGQGILVLYGVFIFTVWLADRPGLQIHSLVIEGTHAVDHNAVALIATDALSKQFLSRVDRNNMFFYPRGSVLSAIIALDPRVADAQLRFDSRHNLRVLIQEFSPALLYCGHAAPPSLSPAGVSGTSSKILPELRGELDDCYVADERGYVFASAPAWSGYPYLAFVAASSSDVATFSPLHSYVLPSDEYVRVREFLATLLSIELYPRMITILGNHDFRIETNSPWDILWSSTKDASKSTENLALVLNSLKGNDPAQNEALHVVDLRFGNKIFYK